MYAVGTQVISVDDLRTNAQVVHRLAPQLLVRANQFCLYSLYSLFVSFILFVLFVSVA